MTNINKKHQILESLDSLDQDQADKVLGYIKGLLYSPNDAASQQKLKREALKEIRQALSGKSKRKMNLSF
jgi:hypothetical protein